jgi:hypothetical protein
VNIAQQPEVAVLLPTYNGARFIDAQIASLAENSRSFTLHWLDDHSSDDTRDTVRASASRYGVRLREWHQTDHLGFPATFFKLIESVEADVYLFCDQDDIWQPGKIDVTVAHLWPDAGTPALCFSLSSAFNNDEPEKLHIPSEQIRDRTRDWMRESRIFTICPAQGNTIGLTRSLRDLFMKHKDIARTHAIDHDWWMYILAVTSGTVQMLWRVPTTLHRRHGSNLSEGFIVRKGKDRFMREWDREQRMRRLLARNAHGFLLALPTLPPGPKLNRFAALARLVADIDRRQSPAALIRLARQGAMLRWWGRTFWRTVIYLSSNAPPPPPAQGATHEVPSPSAKGTSSSRRFAAR